MGTSELVGGWNSGLVEWVGTSLRDVRGKVQKCKGGKVEKWKSEEMVMGGVGTPELVGEWTSGLVEWGR